MLTFEKFQVIFLILKHFSRKILSYGEMFLQVYVARLISFVVISFQD